MTTDNDDDYTECSTCYESYRKGTSHSCKEWEKEAQQWEREDNERFKRDQSN